MKRMLLVILMGTLLTACTSTPTTETPVDKDKDNPVVDKDKEEVSEEQIINKFKEFTKKELLNFELEISITFTEVNVETKVESTYEIRATIKALDKKNYYIEMTTYVEDGDYSVEIYNMENEGKPLIYMRSTFGYPDWIYTMDESKVIGYGSDQFNNLILIPNGTYEYVESKKSGSENLHLINIEINSKLLEELAQATGTTVSNLNVGKLTSNFYVDENGIPREIESTYLTSNSLLEIEIELDNVDQVTEVVVPKKIIESAISAD